jgi:tryptophan halogenase
MTQNNSNQIENIIIVGGGTAGWLAATYLNKYLNKGSDRCRITLIESSDIPTVGVGESTIPTLPRTFRLLGISEVDWMLQCHATFKLAIKFVNWSGLPGKDVFWHPFGALPHSKQTGIPLSYYWQKRKLEGNSEPFDRSCFEAVSLCDLKKSPKDDSDPQYAYKIEYAYHLDAGLLAVYLKNKSKSEGVNHVVDNVLDVALDERGFISHLITEKHGNLYGDLFIDCSGFRGRLINQALQEPFISYSDSLLCDSAIAMPVSYDPDDPYDENNGGINPYTTATALSSGWVWNTPLVGRSGNGYVYSSNFISKADAEAEFRQHLGKKSEGIEARHLKMRIGKNRNAWVKNCVSIGLSSGFIEPLESTGIYLIEVGLIHLIHNFPNKSFHPNVIKNYNQNLTDHYEEIRDFIVMHYCLTQREDSPFWRANKYNLTIPDSLKEKLELWQEMWPDSSQEWGKLFPSYSYMCILSGMGCYPQESLPILAYQDNNSEQDFLEIEKKAETLKITLPDHVDYLKQLSAKNFKSLLKRTLTNLNNGKTPELLR